jgi:hypothetical protein
VKNENQFENTEQLSSHGASMHTAGNVPGRKLMNWKRSPAGALFTMFISLSK